MISYNIPYSIWGKEIRSDPQASSLCASFEASQVTEDLNDGKTQLHSTFLKHHGPRLLQLLGSIEQYFSLDGLETQWSKSSKVPHNFLVPHGRFCGFVPLVSRNPRKCWDSRPKVGGFWEQMMQQTCECQSSHFLVHYTSICE